MKGFTLLEILVSIAIFMIAIGAITSIFISGIILQRRVLAEQEIFNQVSYALEYMGRAIRMAKKDDISIGGVAKNCLGGDKINYETSGTQNELKFRNYKHQCQRFFLQNNQIYEEKYDPNPRSYPLTSPSLRVTSLRFNVSGERQEDNLQPKITIFLEIERMGRRFQFQTTISQRDLDVQY